MTTVLAVRNLQKRYQGIPVFNNASFDLKYGECLALLGPNGVGKTTLFGCLAGLRPYKGTITLTANSNGSTTISERIEALFENGFLYQNWSIEKNFRYFTELTSQEGILKNWPIFERPRRKVKNISTGEKKSLQIAILIQRSPAVVLLDELSNGLDEEARERVKSALLDAQQRGTSFICSSHDRSFLLDIADRAVSIEKGAIIDVSI